MVSDSSQPVSSAASERHRLASALFLEVADLAPEERCSFLDDRCGDDADLRAEVERLLRSDPGFLDSPALGTSFSVEPPASDSGAPTPSSLVGRMFRCYRITGVIASGGMGTVYEAEQSSPHRRVAIKVLRRGLISTSALRRFKYEVEVLGRLHHPGIAEIYEAGTEQEADGLVVPYFAMELIGDAKPITRYASEHGLDVRRRLELFCKVCDAVQHGHQRGVIHRDLKPSNILVDGQGAPKVIDFGVARAIDSDIAITTLHTEVGQLIGTLRYMSPEQCEGRAHDLDTRSDVYSLGVVLYELLCDRAPYEVSERTVPEAIRVIREELATRPSTIDRTLRGDLEVITLKALEKDRTRRYESAAELAADVRRFGNDEPITARPPSAVYQIRKFVLRHKRVAMGIAAIVTLLVGASIVSTVLYLQAEQARGQAAAEHEEALRQAAIAEAVNEFLNEDLLSAVSPDEMGRSVTMREVLDAASATIEGKFADEPLIEAAVRHTLGTTYQKLGVPEEAEPHLTEAHRVYRDEFGDEHPGTLDSADQLFGLYTHQGRFAEAETLGRQVLETRRRVQGDDHRDTLRSMHALGDLYVHQGRYEEAAALIMEALEAQKRVLGDEHRDTLASMNDLANAHSELGDYDRADELYLEAVEIRRRVLGEEHRDTLISMYNLAGRYRDRGRYSKAEPLFLETLETKRRVLGDEHPDTLKSLSGLAILYTYWGRFEEAEPLQLQELQIRKRVQGVDHPGTLGAMLNVAIVYVQQGLYDEAEPLANEALSGYRRVLGEEHPDTAIAMNCLASMYSDQGRYEEAEPLLLEAVGISRRIRGDGHDATLAYINNLAELYKRQGRYDQAGPLFLQTLDTSSRVRGDEHPSTLLCMANLAEMRYFEGRVDEAAELLEGTIPAFRRAYGDAHLLTGWILGVYGSTMLALDHFEEAEARLEEAYAIVTASVGLEHMYAVQQVGSLAELYEAWGKPELAAAWRAKLPAATEEPEGD